MKYLFTLLFSVLMAISLSAQLKITEISYNPPESGTDSLEYIEIFNAGNTAINLEGYSFSKGVVLTFPSVVIQPGKYIVAAVNAEAMERNFNITAIQWTKDALSNNGETIALADPNGNEIVSVGYQKAAPWPTFADGTDGGGRSIELCDPNADPNDGRNWKVSQHDLGFQINGKQMYGTPGAVNSITSCEVEPDYVVEINNDGFSPKDITIELGQSVRWINKGGNHNINGNQAIFPNNPISFGNGNPSEDAWTFDFTFDVAGFYEYQSDPLGSSLRGSVTVKEEEVEDLYPLRTIPQVKGVNADGVADSLGIKCALRGVVHGINFRPAGLQFTIIDNNNVGFGVFNNSNNLGYTVQEGDEIEVKGKIDQFRGLSQLVADSVRVLSTGNALVMPKVLTVFTEADESSYVTIEGVYFVDPSQWTGTGSGFNLKMSDGNNEFLVRIVNATDAYDAPIPTGTLFNVTGIVTQFSGSNSPFNGGYQLQPNYLTDFVAVSGTKDIYDEFEVTLVPNPTNHIVQIQTVEVPDKVEIYNLKGRLMTTYLNTKKIDMSTFAPGMYLFKMNFGAKSKTLRLIKM